MEELKNVKYLVSFVLPVSLTGMAIKGFGSILTSSLRWTKAYGLVWNNNCRISIKTWKYTAKKDRTLSTRTLHRRLKLNRGKDFEEAQRSCMGFSDLEAIGIIQNTTYTERYFRKNKKKIMEELSTCKNDMGFEQCHHICDEGKPGVYKTDWHKLTTRRSAQLWCARGTMCDFLF